MVICIGTGGLGKEKDIGKDTVGEERKDMILIENIEKEDIGKGGSAANIGRGFSPCLHFSH